MGIVIHEISEPLVCVVKRYGQVFSYDQHGVDVLSQETHVKTHPETYPWETAESITIYHTVGTPS